MILANKKDLEETIKQCQKVIPRNGHIPLLHQARFTIDKTTLTIEATDLEISITRAIEVTNTDMLNTRQTFCLNAEHAGNSLKSLPRDVSEVPIAITEKEVTVGSITLVRTNPEEFPKLPELPVGAVHEYTLPDNFTELVARVAPAVSKEAVKYALNGVYCDFTRGVLACSDGKRLHTAALGAKKKMRGLLLPPRCLTIAAARSIVVARKKTEQDMAFLVTENGHVAARVIDGTFPDYTHVIPGTNGKVLNAPRDQIHGMLKEVFAVSRERCTLSLDGAVILSSENSDIGAYKKVVPGKYKGRKIAVSVNPSYLADAVGAVTSENVTISFNNAESALVVTGENDPLTAVVMPLRPSTTLRTP